MAFQIPLKNMPLTSTYQVLVLLEKNINKLVSWEVLKAITTIVFLCYSVVEVLSDKKNSI